MKQKQSGAADAREIDAIGLRTDVPLCYCLFDTALGAVGIAWSPIGLTRLQLPEADPRATESRLRGRADPAVQDKPPPQVECVIADVQSYLEGHRVDFSDVALDLTGISSFYRQLYNAARRVGWGETITYGTLAKQAGFPAAARAVGQAMGRNPLPIIIPCHRILASGGKPGGFSAFGGVATKHRLLALEGVHLDDGTPLLPGL